MSNKHKPNKTQKKQTIKNAQNEQVRAKAKSFFRRYWYWFLVITILAGAVLGWCAGMGYFNKAEQANYDIEEIYLYPYSYYKLNDYLGKDKATYRIEGGESDVISLKGNVLHGNKIGKGVVICTTGKAQKKIQVEVTVFKAKWKLKTGEEIKREQIVNLGSSFGKEINSIFVENSLVFDVMESSSSGTYCAKKEGACIVHLSSDDEPVCDIYISVLDGLKDEERVFSDGLGFFDGEQEFRNYKEISEFKEMRVGEEAVFADFSFSGGGYIYYESSNPDSVFIGQNGKCVTKKPGQSIISVVCGTADGYDYYTIKVSVLVPEIDITKIEEETERNFRVGEIIDEDLLTTRMYCNGTVGFRVEEQYSSYFEVTNEDGEYRLKCLRVTEGQYACVVAIDQLGNPLVRYKIEIEEAEE